MKKKTIFNTNPTNFVFVKFVLFRNCTSRNRAIINMLIKSTITVIDLKNIYIFIARNMLTQKCLYNSIVNNIHTTITLNDGLLTFLEKVWPFIITFY